MLPHQNKRSETGTTLSQIRIQSGEKSIAIRKAEAIAAAIEPLPAGADTRALRSGLMEPHSCWIWFGCLLIVLTNACLALDKSGVSPNTISLPKGPGSIEGLGESFQPSLNTGTAKYGIGFKVPPGVAGHTPKLGLSYEGGGGNGPVGYGWTLPTGFIQRRSDHGIPTYGDNVGFPRDDEFINEMREVLVPQSNGFYFCKNEGAFIRYQQVGDHWVGTVPDGTRLEFGVTANGRIEDAAAGHVFSWLIERETDTRGNVVTYSYASFPDESNSKQKYLSAIHYGPGAPPWTNYHFVALEYEDRPDWFEDCRAGFVVRTGKRLKSVAVGTQGPSLPGHLQGDFDGDGLPDLLDRKYELDYLNYAGTNTHWSLLAKVTPVGADGSRTLPSSTFGYAVCDPPELISAADHIIGSTNEPPVVMDNELVELVDLNGDGLPDILKTDLGGGSHQAYLNRGEAQVGNGRLVQWASPVDVDPSGGSAWNFNLSSATTHLADMDGDGLADLVNKSSQGDVSYFRNLGRTAWSQRQDMSVQSAPPPAPFGQTDVRTADLDFDKRMDVIQSVSTGNGIAYRIWFNLGNQTYSPAITVDQDAGFSFADPGVQIADCNGDRVPDVAQVRPVGVVVTSGLGYGHFAAPITILLPDATLDTTQVARARLTDLNGDGLADLVIERAVPGQCWYWLNLGNYSFSTRKVISGLPAVNSVSAAVRWADINGNGSTDLIYADQESSPRIQAVDLGELLACGATPNLLTRIDNGIGRITQITYRPSTTFALADAAAGSLWPDLMPMPVSVVSEVTTADSLGHQYVTRFRYHDGFYDPQEKQFRGFARVEQIDVGDSSAPTLVSRSYFDTGHDYEVMKGKLLRLTTEQEDGKVFRDVTTAWTIPPILLMTGTNGTNVSFVHPQASQTEILELAQGTPRTLESEMSFDNYGNQTRQVDYGIVVGGDRLAFNDERIAVTEYAINTNAWILRHAARQEIRNVNGAVISRTESYYDDESFAGTNLGSVSVGNLTMSRSWIDPSQPTAYVTSARSKYDAYGNPILLLDPLAVAPGGAVDPASGHMRQIAYDSRFHTYPIRETIYPGNGSDALVFQAGYDEGFGTTTRSVDFNRNETDYAYDVFGRLTQIIKPGDTAAYPTTEYNYAPAVPFGTDGLINYVESRQLDKLPGSAGPNKRDHYLISRVFTDGLGRTLMTKQEAEAATAGVMPRVVISGAVLFNARQKPVQILNPCFTLQPGTNLDQLLGYESIEAPGWKGAFQQNGQLVPLDLAAAHQTSMTCDAMLRTIQVTNPDGKFSRTVYEPLVTKAFDENDTDPASPDFNTPILQYSDGLGRVIRTDETTRLNDDGTPSTQISTWTTQFDYNLNDRLTRITDSQANVKTMAYDGLKRKTAMNDPDCGVVTYAYDDASNLKSTVDAKGQLITYTYDGVNRILTEDYHDENSPEFSYHRSPDVAYHYDVPPALVDYGDGTSAAAQNTRGTLAWVEDTSGEEHTSRDDRGRVAWTVKRIPDPTLQHSGTPPFSLVSYATRFDYDSMDRVTRMVYPDNDQVSYEYNDRGLLQRIVGGPSGSVLSNLVYAPSAQQLQIDYGNGVRTTYEYDQRQRLDHLLTISQPSILNLQLINFSYTFDGVSNIRSIEDQRPASVIPVGDPRRNTEAFSYDDLYRLTGVQYNPAPGNPQPPTNFISYRYDRIGNMLAQTSDITQTEKGLPITDLGAMDYGGTGGRTNRVGRGPNDPPGPHALSSIQHPASSIRTYPYDANGNMTNIDGLDCTWDFKDRLVAAEDDSMRAEYAYDYTDRRITKRVTQKNAATNNLTQPTSYVGKHFEVREHDQPTKFVFNGATRVAEVTGSLSPSTRIQRLQLYPGWNLCSLAVDGASLAVGGDVVSAYKLDEPTQSWHAISNKESLASGTVFWIKASSSATISLTGSYFDPSNRPIAAGASFQSGTGLEALSLMGVNAEVSMSIFDPPSQLWQIDAPFIGAVDRGFPDFLPPGQAVFLNADSFSELAIPDPTLRIRYFHQDHLGSSSVVTDAAGRLVSETAFHPFGSARNEFEPRQVHEPYQFTQKERDKESGMHYFGSRYYAAGISRWLSHDPVAEMSSANPYAYVKNNPMRFVDPTGFQEEDWDALNDSIETAERQGIDCGYKFNWSAWRGDPKAGLAACRQIAELRSIERDTTEEDDEGSFFGGMGDALTGGSIVGAGMDNQTLRENLGISTVHPGRGTYFAGGVAGIVIGVALGGLKGGTATEGVIVEDAVVEASVPKAVEAPKAPPPVAKSPAAYAKTEPMISVPAPPSRQTLPGWQSSTQLGTLDKEAWIARESAAAAGTRLAIQKRGGNAFMEVMEPIFKAADKIFGIDILE